MKLSGLVPAAVTPFTDDGDLDRAALQAHVHRVGSSAGVGGVAVLGHAGEILALTGPERAAVITQSSQALPAGIPLIAGIEGPTGPKLVAEAIQAAEAGAEALLVLPPFDVRPHRQFSRSLEATLPVFEQLDREVGLPVVVFQYPAATGCAYSLEVLDALADIPSVQAIKASTGPNVAAYMELYDLLRDRIAVLAAADSPTLLSMLLYGAAGSLIGVSVIGTPIWAELLRQAAEGDYNSAVRLFFERCVPLTTATHENAPDAGSTVSPIALTKEALFQLGELPNAVCRPPAFAPDDSRKKAVTEALRKAGLLSAA
jgi:4-hydroxy-tetrahydrodipicolinate synthase